MPSYHYHIKLELYQQDPISQDCARARRVVDVWQPPGEDADIFEPLPIHERTSKVNREQGVGRKTAAGTEEDALSATGKDWRFGQIRIESYDTTTQATRSRLGQAYDCNAMASETDNQGTPAASLGPNLGGPGQATKGKYTPLQTNNTNAGWGIVHLYREQEVKSSKLNTRGGNPPTIAISGDKGDDEETILCIPSVPSYLSPNDFLGFIGDKWIGDVSHYRMIMTSRMNRYMVLMKFRNSRIAKEWRQVFDGRAFDSMGAEMCHVTFIKSITIETPPQTLASSGNGRLASSAAGPLNSARPFPPPTPDLTELPTCTVCLERMDDTAGLMTILCQHVFHCTCLQTWKGSGCPICRATNRVPITGVSGALDYLNPDDPSSGTPFGDDAINFCTKCDTTDDLWICLICGNVGCGRYKNGHAKEHWRDTVHTFSLELETQHVWDYASDSWVHRLIREKGEGKVVEFPSSTITAATNIRAEDDDQAQQDVVPRAKLESIGMEYSHLLTSQLESQRLYFAEMVNKAAAKAAKASAAAEAAASQAQEALSRLRVIEDERKALEDDTIPSLERDVEREKRRSEKSTDLARKLGVSLQEEKKINEGLMKRLEHITKDVDGLKRHNEGLAAELVDMKDQNHDLSMFISGQEKLKQLEEEGQLQEGEVEDGEVGVVEKKGRRGKGKKK